MKKSILLLFIALIIFSCQSDQSENPEKFEALMKDFFDSVENRNMIEIKAITTEDFTFFSRGKSFNFDSFEKLINNFPPVKTENKLENIEIDIDTRIATMRYSNHYTIHYGKEITSDFLESIVFKKDDGVWKIAFMQSTEVNSPKTK